MGNKCRGLFTDKGVLYRVTLLVDGPTELPSTRPIIEEAKVRYTISMQ